MSYKRDMSMKQVKTNTAVELSIGATILFGLAVLVIKAKWPEVWSPVFWITPAFFYLYEVVFMWLLGRYGSMKPDKVLTTSMIMRGVKFLGVAALMVAFVKLGLAGRVHFLLYTLIYYVLTSFCETWTVGVYNKNKES